MGEQLNKNTLALYGDKSSNFAYRNNSEKWTDSESNKEIVERCGFVPLRNRVLALMQSGEALLQARKNAFQYAEDEEPEDFEVDETLQQDCTELDILQKAKDLKERIKERKKNAVFNNRSNDNIASNAVNNTEVENNSNNSEKSENVNKQ